MKDKSPQANVVAALATGCLRPLCCPKPQSMNMLSKRTI